MNGDKGTPIIRPRSTNKAFRFVLDTASSARRSIRRIDNCPADRFGTNTQGIGGEITVISIARSITADADLNDLHCRRCRPPRSKARYRVLAGVDPFVID